MRAGSRAGEGEVMDARREFCLARAVSRGWGLR